MAEPGGIGFREGAYLAAEDLSISVLDPAFCRSDVVFDVVSVTDAPFSASTTIWPLPGVL